MPNTPLWRGPRFHRAMSDPPLGSLRLERDHFCKFLPVFGTACEFQVIPGHDQELRRFASRGARNMYLQHGYTEMSLDRAIPVNSGWSAAVDVPLHAPRWTLQMTEQLLRRVTGLPPTVLAHHATSQVASVEFQQHMCWMKARRWQMGMPSWPLRRTRTPPCFLANHEGSPTWTM